MPIVISKAAERHLDAWVLALQDGRMSIWQLPLAVQQFVSFGLAEAAAIYEPRLRQLEHVADVLYMQAYTPKARQAEYRRRMDEHFAFEEAAFFKAAEETDYGAREFTACRAA